MKHSFLYFLFIAAILLVFNLGKWGVIETSEARYAEISKEMVENGNYLQPKLLNINHFHKPPVTYYITAIGYHIFGVNAFGARFFLQVALILQLVLIYYIAYILYDDKKTALLASLIYFSLPLVLISSRNLTTDAYLNTFILASLYFWISYKKSPGKIWFLYFFYTMLGVIFETKGPVGFIFPLVFIICYNIIFKERFKIHIHHILGVLLCLVISSAWYILLIIDNPGILDYFIKHQLIDRMASNSFNRGKPIWYYLMTLPLLGFPWIIFLMVHFKMKFKTIVASKQIDWVLISSVLTVFVIFSIFKTKLVFYILPMFGFIALASANILNNATQKLLRIYNNVIIIGAALLVLSLLVISMLNINFQFDVLHAVMLCVLVIMAVYLITKYQHGSLKTASLGFLFGCILILSGDLFLPRNEDQLNSTKNAVNFIETQLKDTQHILVYNYLMPSVTFYSTKNIITLQDGYYTTNREVQFETNSDWKKNLYNLQTEEGKQATDSILKHRAVVIARKKSKLPPFLNYLNDDNHHKKVFGKWIVYY